MKNPLAAKRDPVVPMPARQPIEDVEAEIANFARINANEGRNLGLGGSREMQRAKEILSSGLTAAYKDGAEALEHAIDEANQQRDVLKLKVDELDKQMDTLKREAAEHILELRSKSVEITALVEARVEHLTSMVKWVEEQRATLANPPTPPRPAAAIEAPVEELEEEDSRQTDTP
jgi:chromosome segregation ATPase